MKWKNKGHEYDNIEMNFNAGTKIWIYGAGENGKDLCRELAFADCVAGFIDNNAEKIKAGIWEGKQVISSESFLAQFHDNCIVVVAVALPNMPVVVRQMIRSGWEEGKNLFIYHIFHYSYLPIWALRSWGKIYIPTVSFLVTTMCNLDCKGCLNFTHFNKNKRHYDLERLKSDIDLLFKKVNYIGYLHLSGGEPFLHPHLEVLIEYIDSNYKHQIGILGTTTNGTIIPKESLCKTLKKADIRVWIDDYRENVPLAKEKFEKVKKQLEDFDVCCISNQTDQWLDIQNTDTELDEKKLRNRCEACDVPFVSVKDHKIYGCNYCDYAWEAGISEGNENDYLDLEQISEGEKAQITEFIMGYSDNGYYTFCKNCSGYQASNQKQIKVAEQYK